MNALSLSAKGKVSIRPADFRLPREGMRLQFRAEFFNALNHTNFQAPAGDRASSAFGIITAALPARIGQLALKLVW